MLKHAVNTRFRTLRFAADGPTRRRKRRFTPWRSAADGPAAGKTRLLSPPFRRNGVAVPAQRHRRSGATASPFRRDAANARLSARRPCPRRANADGRRTPCASHSSSGIPRNNSTDRARLISPIRLPSPRRSGHTLDSDILPITLRHRSGLFLKQQRAPQEDTLRGARLSGYQAYLIITRPSRRSP